MDYISVKTASEKWGISERRIQKLCEENRIEGTLKFGRAWMVPKNVEKPIDGEEKKNKIFKGKILIRQQYVTLQSINTLRCS
ncbi:hypothetical protein D1872_230590 [compost metagenome]